jgi:hypothetical protein
MASSNIPRDRTEQPPVTFSFDLTRLDSVAPCVGGFELARKELLDQAVIASPIAAGQGAHEHTRTCAGIRPGASGS